MKTIMISVSEIKKLLRVDEQFPTEEIMLKIIVDASVTISYRIENEKGE